MSTANRGAGAVGGVSGPAGGAGPNQPIPSSPTEAMLPSVLWTLSQQGYNTTLSPRNRGAVRTTSKFMKKSMNNLVEGEINRLDLRKRNTNHLIPRKISDALAAAYRRRDIPGIQEIVRKGFPSGFLRQEVGVNIIDAPVTSTGESILYLAVENNDLEMVQALLEMGANPNGRMLLNDPIPEDSLLPAGTTLPNGKQLSVDSVVKPVVALPVGTRMPDGTVLSEQKSIPEYTELPAGILLPDGTLLSEGLRPDELTMPWQYPDGRPVIVGSITLPKQELLQQQGALTSYPDPRALWAPTTNLAAYNANLPILQALVAAGANINSYAGGAHADDPPILVSLECALVLQNRNEGGGKYRYNTQLAERAKADPDLFQKFIGIFYFALDNGGDVNILGMGMRTPIRSAVALTLYDPGAIAVVEELLNRGANPDVRDNMGFAVYSAREVVNSRGTPALRALMESVPPGGAPRALPAPGANQPTGGATGGASSAAQGGGRRSRQRLRKTRQSKKGRKQTKRKFR